MNYELISNNRGGEYQKPCLLIIRREIMPESWISYLIEWKHRKGFDVVSEDFAATASIDDIKNYIQDAYDNLENPPEYVIITGGGQQTGQSNYAYSIPPAAHQDQSNHGYRSDQNYGFVDGDDWLPDLLIGRLPFVTSSGADTNIAKIFNYEIDKDTNDTWIEDIYLLSDPRYTTTGAYIHSKVTTNEYVESIIPHENSSYSIDFVIDENPSTTTSTTKINSGLSFFNFLGDIDMANIDPVDINNLTNGEYLPLISAITCGSGAYPNLSMGVGDDFLNAGSATQQKGAIGFIGSSLNFTSTVFNNHYSVGIASALFDNGIYTFGGALAKGQLTLYTAFFDEFSSEYETDGVFYAAEGTMLWNNLWGDPTIELWTSVPQEMVVTGYPSSQTFGENYVEITVTDSNTDPIEDVVVCLLKETATGDDEIFETYYTDANGDVLIPYIALTTGEVLVTATKHNFVPHLGSFDIEADVSSVNFFELIVDDDNYLNIHGVVDGFANPGEMMDLDIVLKNYGSTLAQNVTAEITSSNPFVNILTGTASYENITAGSTESPLVDFKVSIDLNCPNEDILLDIEIQDNANTYDGVIVLPIAGFDIVFTEINGSVFPNGSSANITITISNTGEVVTPNFYTKLIGSFNGLTINDEYGNFSPILSGETGETNDNYTLTASSEIIPGSVFNMELEIYVDSNHQTLFSSIDIPLTVGLSSVTDPLGPDTYGYLCYDDEDSSYDEVANYEWIEITEIGTPLTLLNQLPGDNDFGAYNEVINLPFDFTFYGVTYNDKLTVSSAGWISFGEQDEAAFYNSPLPGPLGPFPMIAVFWDELNYNENTSYASYYYDEIGHRLIIEWDQFENNFTDAEETFQVILYDSNFYPSLTDDGLIKIQYKVINNDNVGATYKPACYSSVGLEDHTQSIGLQYTYYNNYPDAAKELEDEMAIEFTTGRNIQQATMNIPLGQSEVIDHLYIENGSTNYIYGTLTINDVLQINSNSTLVINGTLIMNSANLFVLESSQVEQYGTLDLRNGSSVEFIDESSFSVEAGATIQGDTPATYVLEEYFPGDRIVIQDGSNFGIDGDALNRVTITSSDIPNRWEGIKFEDYSPIPVAINNCDFSYIDKLQFTDDDTDMEVVMTNCNFNNSGQIVVQDLLSFDYVGINHYICDISENTASPILTFGTETNIKYCEIYDNLGHGIALFYPPTDESAIENVEIYENNYYGIYLYQSEALIDNCIVEDNRYHGIVALHESVSKLKDCTIQNNGNPQPGHSNNGSEIYAISGSFPNMYKDYPTNYTQGMNTIYDAVDDGSNDHYLLNAIGWETGDPQIPVWGNTFPNSTDPGYSGRFYPEYNTFAFTEVPDDPKESYKSAQEDIMAEDYDSAKLELQSLITTYPDEDYYVACSLNWLLFLEKFENNNYDDLRNYIQTLNLPEDQEQALYNIVSQTYAQEQNYYDAISRFEEIILNPPSTEELTFATIDEGYYYLKAQEGSQTNRGILDCSVKPGSFDDFLEMINDLDSELYQGNTTEDTPLYKMNAANYPNPFNPTTSIAFNLAADSKINLAIYNIKGQKVKQLVNEELSAGQHSIEWNGKDSSNRKVSSGIYFYKLSSDFDTEMKKMLLLK